MVEAQWVIPRSPSLDSQGNLVRSSHISRMDTACASHMLTKDNALSPHASPVLRWSSIKRRSMAQVVPSLAPLLTSTRNRTGMGSSSMIRRKRKPRRMFPVLSAMRPTPRGPKRLADLSVKAKSEKKEDSCPYHDVLARSSIPDEMGAGLWASLHEV